MPDGQQLSRKQEKAIAALLAERTIQNTAARAKISERTLMYWLKQPVFAAEYRAARQRVVEHAITLLQQTTSLAVDTLTRNMLCGKASVEVVAAGKILEHAVAAVELFDLAGRVAELEQTIKTQGTGYENRSTFPNSRNTFPNGGPSR
jgi:hypothetical protein